MKRLWLILFVFPIFAQGPLKYSIKFSESTQSNMPVLFLMHGYGNNEKQFNELIEELNSNFLIVSMRAPFNFMLTKYRWYEYSISNGDTLSNQAQINESTNKIIQTIELIKKEYNVDEQKIFIGGFSQGGIMSYKLALLYPNKFKGIVVHSARLPVEYSIKEPNTLYKNLNILIIHGSKDRGLSTKWAYQGKDLFEKLGANTNYYEAKIGHKMNKATYGKIKQWLYTLKEK